MFNCLIITYDKYKGKIEKSKHQVKVHFWAGISARGPAEVIIFEAKMNSSGFINLLEIGLVSF